MTETGHQLLEARASRGGERAANMSQVVKVQLWRARSAYEMIVLAFANGDRRALKDLLSSEVYDSFDAVIKDREKHEQKTETRFVSIDKAELVSAEARDRAAQLTVRFVSQMISVTRDKTGAIVDGNPDKVADITDVWTFARDTSSRDPNWKLVGTGSAA